ncbi:uncharacterized protein LOC111362538 [Spodoptera litura]|uniref:Uncharacterized protein LOC111362538 n=1 Tax=Spodoptera litura TaxID=69820 RepID=A0A9J7ETD3_SPOLT|nr:uncharacterized protein LOC111362538 [Spodoptera litura]
MEPVPSTSFDMSQRHDHDEPLENILSSMFTPEHNMPSPDYEMQTQEVLNDEDLYGILLGDCDNLLNEEMDEDEDNHPHEEDEDDTIEQPGHDWSIGNPHRQNVLDFQKQTGLKVDNLSTVKVQLLDSTKYPSTANVQLLDFFFPLFE